jgi:small subunit ribosomal protein S2
MVDTNCDPNKVDYAIPANDDAAKSIELIIKYLTDAIAEGLEERAKSKEEADEAAKTEEEDDDQMLMNEGEDEEDRKPSDLKLKGKTAEKKGPARKPAARRPSR